MKFVFRFLFIVFLSTPAVADEDALQDIYADLLLQYARHAATLQRCNRGPGEVGIRALSERITQWRYPGWLSWRARSNLDDELFRRANLVYSVQVIGRCGSAIEVSTAQMLVQQISMTLERELPE